MLDIVIPTLNEEHYLGKLLSSLVNQTFKDFKVYVSDGKSRDKTVEIAKSFRNTLDIKVIVNKKRGVAHQRNEGAKLGRNKYILFLDADTVIDSTFIESFIFKSRIKDVGCCWLKPLSNKKLDKFMFDTYNIILQGGNKYLYPIVIGANMYTKRKVFIHLKGFNENLKICEDVDYVFRAIMANYSFKVIKKLKVNISTRRLDALGRTNFLKAGIKVFYYVYFKKMIPTQDNIYYPMGLDYKKIIAEKEISKNKFKYLN